MIKYIWIAKQISHNPGRTLFLFYFIIGRSSLNSGVFASFKISKIKLSAVVKNAPAFIILYNAVDLSIGL